MVCHLTLWWGHTRLRAVFVVWIDFSVLSNSVLECQTFTVPLMDTLTLKRERYFYSLQFSWNPNFPKSLGSNHQPSILCGFLLSDPWSCRHFPKDWVNPAFLISECTPGPSCCQSSALSKWIFATRNIDHFLSVKSQSASFPSLYSFPYPSPTLCSPCIKTLPTHLHPAVTWASKPL